MTADEFNAEYRLGQCLTSDGIRSTLAQEARKGRLVLVHELSTGSPPEQRRVEILLRQLAPGDAAQVIGSYEVDGAPVVVTKFLLGFTSLLAWLEACVAQSQTRVIDTRDNPPTMDMAIHDPERYRRRPPEPIVAPALEDTSVRPVVPARPAPSTPDAPPVAPPATVAGSTPAADGAHTGSFTQLFGAPTAAPPAAVPPQPAAAPASDGPGGPGSFTQLFGAGAASPEPGPRPVTDAVPHPAAPAPIDTSSFHTPPIGPPATPATVQEPATGDFTRLFGGRAAPAPTPPPQAPPLRAPRPEPAAAAPPIPAPRRDPAGLIPFDDDAPVAAALGSGPGAPPPPRVRLDALSNIPSLDPAATSRRESDLASGGLSSQPPVPFSTPGPIGGSVSAGGIAPPPLATERPAAGYRGPAVPPSAPVASPAGGGYTEVLTPARPPLTPAPPRLPTPAAGPPPPPRPSFVPLLVGLLVFGVLAIAVVVGFVMTSS